MLSRTAENLYWMARYIERAETNARLLEVAARNVDAIRRFRNLYSVSLENIGERVNASSDSDDEAARERRRRGPIPGHSLPLALDPEYSTLHYCREEDAQRGGRGAPRRILAINDTTWLLNKFRFADPATGVEHNGTSVAHPDDPNVSNWLPNLTFTLIPSTAQKLAGCKVWYCSLSRAHTNPAKLDALAAGARAQGGSDDMQVIIIGGQEINES